MKDVSELYKADLLFPQLLSTEFNDQMYIIPLDDRPNTLQAALQYCDKDAFPNIYVLLLIAGIYLTCNYL